MGTWDATWGGLQVGQRVEDFSAARWRLTSIPDGAPAAVAASDQRVQRDGVWRSTAYQGGLSGPLGGVAVGRTEQEAEAMWAALRAAASVNLAPLTIQGPDGPVTLFVARESELDRTRLSPTHFTWSCTVVAPDPVWWRGDQTPNGGLDDSARITRSAYLPARSGGLIFPITFPAVFAETGDTGDIMLDLPSSARISIRIFGPVLNPSVAVAHGVSTRVMSWRIQLEAGEWLDVDPQARTSLLQGQSSRPPWRREWPDLSAGASTVSFRAESYNAAARLDIYIRPLA